MKNIKNFEVPLNLLRQSYDESLLKFEDTTEIEAGVEPFGQERAINALNFGLSVKNKAFNIYVTGPIGCGKTSIIKKVLKERAKQEPVGFDYVYVNNFADASKPISIKLDRGQGKTFEQDIENLMKDLKIEIPKAIDTPRTNEKRMNIIKKYQKLEAEIYQEISEFTKENGFVLEKTQAGIVARPLNLKGQFMTEEEYTVLSPEEKQDIEKRQMLIQKKMDQSARKELKNEKAFKQEISKFEEDVVSFVITPIIDDLKKKYKENDKVCIYLNSLKENVLKHSQAFLMKDAQNEKAQLYLEYIFSLFKVNLFINRLEEENHAPVVFETNPTYSNLFGWIEHEERHNYLSTDYSKIKAGAIHKANGGYLIIQVVDLLKNPFAYDDLKRALRNKKTKIGDNPLSTYTIRPLKKLEPEDIDLDVKVILIGSSYYFTLLNYHDEEFSRLFKVKSDFDSFIKKDDENLQQFFKFLNLKTKEKEILPLDKSGVAEMIDFSTRLSGHSDRLSTRLSSLEDILFEANYFAIENKKKVISREDIEKAIENKENRHNKFETIIRDTIYDGTIMIDIEGNKVGEINGLAVYSLDEYSFGVPSKITARTYAGKHGIINIEREANLSGKIHDKGIAILSGYLGGLFRDITPLNISASISFEQNYGGVDGDSASSTETYAILSSLSGIPIKQTIAVTGSVNQMGIIQPIGGVNEKIEGFYAICKHFGLTGEQGVMIPKKNIKHLMLKKEVVEAVKNNKFKIYAIETIEEGIEILTGVPFGEKIKSGGYTKDSILDKAYETLMEFVHQNAELVKKAKSVNEKINKKTKEIKKDEKKEEKVEVKEKKAKEKTEKVKNKKSKDESK